MPSALILDDDPAERTAVAEIVEQCGFKTWPAETLGDAREIIDRRPLDLALVDLELPDGNGLELLPLLDELPRIDVIVISGRATVDHAVAAFRSGIVDLMTKPIDPRRLRESLAKARHAADLYGKVKKLRGELRELGRFGQLVGRSPAMQQVYDLTAKVAPTKSTAFIIGETGTGKELVAATIHELSKRADLAYLPINCGAIQPNLIESELFGHERGAFTGAERQRQGLFERAAGGTIFFDEVTEMPLELQVKLLRVLETGEFTRVGGDKLLRSDARIIAATNRDPEQAVRDELLREDLMYRLLVFPIRLPPLRERGGDVLLLAEHFLKQANRENETRKRLAPDVLQQLVERDWPGNVRELKNAIDRAYILADDASDLAALGPAQPAAAGPGSPGNRTVEIKIGQTIAEAEQRLILATLEAAGDKKQAAKTLGISLKTLYTRLNKYGHGR